MVNSVPPRRPVVVRSRSEREAEGTDLVLILHGYGSDTDRVSGLFDALPPSATGVAIRGPFEMDDDEYGWFLLDWGLRPDLAHVLEAAQHAFTVQDELAPHHRSVSVAGHSQGMAMATTMMRLRPGRYATGVGLSGFVVDQPLLDLGGGTEADPVPFFWGRDRADLVINPDAQDSAGEWLEERTRLTARTYPGMGHGIGAEELRDVAAFWRLYLGT
ncbi:alpha/beta hydrolase [Galactobacter caseinivorans]|uniref:alpha/beta hydrolase n=1 Tax=Galactobacter caseinivorans TaxID=2676123 RepID=UPI001F38BE23|nr:phospholipase [Galactobacter caseinivorans]